VDKKRKKGFSVSKYVSCCWLVTARDRQRNQLEFNVVHNIYKHCYKNSSLYC